MSDHDSLRELAEHVRAHGSAKWFTEEDLRFHNITPGDAGLIAAAGPDVVLGLLDYIDLLEEDLRLTRAELVAEKHKALEHRKGQGRYEGKNL
jgi:hypothetical protein